MPMNRKLLGAAAFSLALAGGGAAGAVLGTPNLSLAQDSETSDDGTEASPDGFRHGPGVQLEVAAEAIGITEEELLTALQDGQSIAQVAEANGVDVQTVIDAMVAAGTERLESAIEALPDRIAEAVEREGLPDRGPGGPGGPGHGHFGAGLDAAAEAIGIDSEDLRTALRDGSTIAEVAEQNGVDVQTVIDALVADAESALDEAVANERLTEDQAADIKENLPDRIEAMVNGEGPFGHRGGPGFGPPEAEADTDAEGSSTAA